ncbi:hypothetical protein CLFE_003230 [Clostridium felsineum DSM 794]|nr:hypothetical protein CLFE_003230 [Clostridium felsineum DSM 794]
MVNKKSPKNASKLFITFGGNIVLFTIIEV